MGVGMPGDRTKPISSKPTAVYKRLSMTMNCITWDFFLSLHLGTKALLLPFKISLLYQINSNFNISTATKTLLVRLSICALINRNEQGLGYYYIPNENIIPTLTHFIINIKFRFLLRHFLASS